MSRGKSALCHDMFTWQLDTRWKTVKIFIQNLVPSKYKLRFRDVKPSLNQGEDIFLLHMDTVLLKEPGLYCFLLRCKRDEAEPFMEWAVETVLPREVWKLTSAIEEKYNQIQAL